MKFEREEPKAKKLSPMTSPLFSGSVLCCQAIDIEVKAEEGQEQEDLGLGAMDTRKENRYEGRLRPRIVRSRDTTGGGTTTRPVRTRRRVTPSSWSPCRLVSPSWEQRCQGQAHLMAEDEKNQSAR